MRTVSFDSKFVTDLSAVTDIVGLLVVETFNVGTMLIADAMGMEYSILAVGEIESSVRDFKIIEGVMVGLANCVLDIGLEISGI